MTVRWLLALTFLVMRTAFAGDGDLDTSFSSSGYVVQAPTDGSLVGYAVAIQDDGNIVIGGTRWAFNQSTDQNQAAIWRLLPDGSPDTSFGSSGSVSLPFGSAYPIVDTIVVQSDGTILAGGSFGGFGVLRLHSDGNLDTTFGSGGTATIDFSDLGIQASSTLGATIDNQGRILLAGGGTVSGYPNWRDALVARLLPNGVLDTSFGMSGRVVVQFGDSTTQLSAEFFSAATDAADRIWLSGNGSPTLDPSAVRKFLAARLDANGNLDPNFGGTGIVGSAFAAISDNRGAYSVLRGNHLTIGGTCDVTSASNNPSFCLLRLLEDGTVDPTFGTAGWTDAPVNGGLLPYSSIACQSDDRCLILGAGAPSSSAHRQFIVARVDAAGMVDTTFGAAGMARIDVPTTGDGSHIAGRAIALQGGRPVLAGTTDGVPYVYGLYVTRLTADVIFGNDFE